MLLTVPDADFFKSQPSGEIVSIEVPVQVTMSFGEMFLGIYSLYAAFTQSQLCLLF